jgi:hypothetical protein
MGRHEEPLPDRTDGTFWGTARQLARQPLMFLVLLLAILLGLSILAVQVGNAYGAIWGAAIGGGVAPLAGSMLLRARTSRSRRSRGWR